MSVSSELTALADSIRTKSGATAKLGIATMKTAVDGIETYDPFAGFEMLKTLQYASGAPDKKFAASVPQCISLGSAFSACSEELDVELTTTTNLRNLENFAYNSKIKTIKFIGTTERVTTFARFAANASNLTSVKNLNFSYATNAGLAFSGASALTEIEIVAGTIEISISFADSPSLSDASIQSIVDGLTDLTGSTAQTLTLHTDVKAKLTEEQTAAVTAKNWTLA